jgi:hypothetical protein
VAEVTSQRLTDSPETKEGSIASLSPVNEGCGWAKRLTDGGNLLLVLYQTSIVCPSTWRGLFAVGDDATLFPLPRDSLTITRQTLEAQS